jgi:hypothetical protein
MRALISLAALAAFGCAPSAGSVGEAYPAASDFQAGPAGPSGTIEVWGTAASAVTVEIEGVVTGAGIREVTRCSVRPDGSISVSAALVDGGDGIYIDIGPNAEPCKFESISSYGDVWAWCERGSADGCTVYVDADLESKSVAGQVKCSRASSSESTGTQQHGPRISLDVSFQATGCS